MFSEELHLHASGLNPLLLPPTSGTTPFTEGAMSFQFWSSVDLNSTDLLGKMDPDGIFAAHCEQLIRRTVFAAQQRHLVSPQCSSATVSPAQNDSPVSFSGLNVDILTPARLLWSPVSSADVFSPFTFYKNILTAHTHQPPKYLDFLTFPLGEIRIRTRGIPRSNEGFNAPRVRFRTVCSPVGCLLVRHLLVFFWKPASAGVGREKRTQTLKVMKNDTSTTVYRPTLK